MTGGTPSLFATATPVAIMAACLVFGSFAATMAIRFERGEQWLTGRSRCDHCSVPLLARETIPLVSWAVGRGRCGCRAQVIDLIHPASEALSAVVAIVAIVLTPSAAGWTALLGCLLLACALVDLRTFIIPDVLSLGILIGGIAFRLMTSAAVLESVFAAALTAAVFYLTATLFQRLRGVAGLGLGDVKLAGAAAMWLDPTMIPWAVLVAAVIALAGRAVFALPTIRIARDRPAFPFAPFLAAGFWITFVAARGA